MDLLLVVVPLQPGAVSVSGGETCRCNAAGPELSRSAAGYTPHTTSTPRPDLQENSRAESGWRRSTRRCNTLLILDHSNHLEMESGGQEDWGLKVSVCPLAPESSLQRQRSAHSLEAEKGSMESSSLKKRSRNGKTIYTLLLCLVMTLIFTKLIYKRNKSVAVGRERRVVIPRYTKKQYLIIENIFIYIHK